MRKIVIDLAELKKLGELNRDKNIKFRMFLKSRDGKSLDENVHKLYEKISEQIDCTRCGNCCINLSPPLTNKEIDILSRHLNISSKEFEDTYIELDEENCKCLSKIPCIFLKDKICSVYEIRPTECAEYPYLHKKGFSSRLLGVIENYSVCPIVFNVYEELKILYNFR
ncbi:MAG: YkgJ family cysteine cluster protein [Ignavibacteria bacterium]|nr:YkgJ family cysteine cluster protein [Ignavibacteria bacterium]